MKSGVMRAFGQLVLGFQLFVSTGVAPTVGQQHAARGVMRAMKPPPPNDRPEVSPQEIVKRDHGSEGSLRLEARIEAPRFDFDTIRRGDSSRKEIALTFDDGPHPPFTQRLLDLLKRLDLQATFFVVGRKVDQAPELLRRMIHEGHEIENHTYHHFNLKMVPSELTDSEIRLDNDAIRRACGRVPIFFRPSGGQFNAEVVDAVQRLHMVMALWTDDPGDYDLTMGSAKIESRLLDHVRPGAIILLHDGMEQTFDMLPDFVARMRHDGFKFVTLRELAQRLEAVHRAR